MKLKVFTFSALFLLIVGTIEAQISQFTRDNPVDITILAKDTIVAGNTQLAFDLVAPETQIIHNINAIRLKIAVNYEATTSRTSYFRLYYKITSELNGFVILNHGTTVPVLIPPIRKDSTRVGINNPNLSLYPHSINIPLSTLETTTDYKLELDLVQYANQQDYLTNSNNTEGPSLDIDLVYSERLSTNENSQRSSAIHTYPNPSDNFVTIAYDATDDNPPKNIPIQLTIFNKQGIRLSNHSLVRVALEDNKFLYNLDISHLPKGMYFCQVKYGEKTEVKTIIKK